MICDWWISIHFACFCVSRFIACDRNYDWRQWKTLLWRRLLTLRVRMFVKSAVKHLGFSSQELIRFFCEWINPTDNGSHLSSFLCQSIQLPDNLTSELEAIQRNAVHFVTVQFLESPGNFSGLKSNIQIEIQRIKEWVLASKLLHFDSLTDGFIMLDANPLKPRSLR